MFTIILLIFKISKKCNAPKHKDLLVVQLECLREPDHMCHGSVQPDRRLVNETVPLPAWQTWNLVRLSHVTTVSYATNHIH